MGEVAAVAISVLFLVALASAEVPSGNAFIGYSYYNSTNLSSPLFGRATTNGLEASIEGKVLPFMGLVADFDGHFGSETVSTCQECRLAVQLLVRSSRVRIGGEDPSFRRSADRCGTREHPPPFLDLIVRDCRGWWFRLQSPAFDRLAIAGRLRLHEFVQRQTKQCACVHRNRLSLLSKNCPTRLKF